MDREKIADFRKRLAKHAKRISQYKGKELTLIDRLKLCEATLAFHDDIFEFLYEKFKEYDDEIGSLRRFFN